MCETAGAVYAGHDRRPILSSDTDEGVWLVLFGRRRL
jgi:hypothetical protein